MVELNLIVEEFFRFVDIFGDLIRASEVKKPSQKGNTPVNFLSEEETDILKTMGELGQAPLSSMKALKENPKKEDLDPNTRFKKIYEFLLKNKYQINNWLVPALEACGRSVHLSMKMMKFYFDINTLYALENWDSKLESLIDSDDFERNLKESREFREQYEQEYYHDKNIWEEKERFNKMKIQKKWNFHQKRLFQDRGIWQTDVDQNEIIRFKVDKAEDFCRRRLRLKRDFRASAKEYLNAQAYQEKIRKQAEI